MVLEATMIIIDNSEPSRNGDYPPTRFLAQSDCANLLFTSKTSSNPESSVGLISLGGSSPEVLTTLTTDHGRIIDGLHRTKIRGVPHFGTALNVAGLALKHRQNKSQHPRVVVFLCSGIGETEQECVKLGRRLKKNGVAVDVVVFGDVEGETVKKVEAFHNAIKSSTQDAEGGGDDASHLAVVPPGPNLLSDTILASPIVGGTGMGANGAGGAGAGDGADGGAGGEANGFEFGIDPSADPELALALRMSMEEEERRQREQRERETADAGGEKLESVPEAGEGEASGSGSGAAPDTDGTSGDVKKDDGDKKDGEGGSDPAGDDKMDTS